VPPLFRLLLAAYTLDSILQRERRIYYYLWQLYHLQQDEAQALAQQADLQQQLEELNAAAEGFEAQLAEQRRQHGGLVKERMRIEKEQKKLQKKQAAKVGVPWLCCGGVPDVVVNLRSERA
jgi:hypothetical protein